MCVCVCVCVCLYIRILRILRICMKDTRYYLPKVSNTDILLLGCFRFFARFFRLSSLKIYR